MEAERYNRQIILNGFGEAAQLKLSDARLLVIGAGGLGCPALQYLTAAGVGHIGIVDDDIIALSNLHRQILFSTADIGLLKVEIAAKRLQEMNPGIEIIPYPVRLEKSNALDILGGYDLILDGTDNFQSRYLINDACSLLDKPLIFAAVSGYEGQLAIFSIGDDGDQRANYRDLFPVPPEPGEIPNCAESGVLGVLPGILGTMAAAEIIKLITGIGKPLINKLIHYNLLTNEQYEMSISPAHDYKMPKTEFDFFNMEYEYSRSLAKGYIEIDAPQLTSLQREASTLIIDVRERHEVPVLDSRIFNKIPMSEFDAFLKTDVAAQNIVLICQHGIRSVAAAEALQEKYGCTKRIYSLKGGIVKWSDHFLKA